MLRQTVLGQVTSAASLSRRDVLITCSLTAAAFLTPELRAQDPGSVDLKPRKELLVAKDGFRLAATYWPSGLKQDASIVVLLHGHSGTQLDWGTLPKQLQDEGYAVLTVDLRGHGQSKGNFEEVEAKSKSKTKPKTGRGTLDAANLRSRDYEAMVLGDMEAVKQFIFNEHQARRLNMNRTGFVGAGMGAAVAIKAANLDWLKKPHSDGPVGNQTPRGQDVRALVLLSVDGDVPGLSLSESIKAMRLPILGISMLFGAGKKDKAGYLESKKLYDQAVAPDGNDSRIYFVEYDTAAKGTGLLGKRLPVELNISNFLKKHLQEIPSEWRDRESRVGRPRR